MGKQLLRGVDFISWRDRKNCACRCLRERPHVARRIVVASHRLGSPVARRFDAEVSQEIYRAPVKANGDA
ncbi:Hypothetical protein BN69_3632 [Methylocystis sp. SC2]|nr:Hypothetical protein BN69_3632 [Methylocystis sp. SC2]